MDETQIKEMVRARYGSIATGTGTSEDSAPSDSSCCSPAASSCCGPEPASRFEDKALRMGYSEAESGAVPEGANLGLGCGNPFAVAAMRAGEVVIDLGSGAGFDCFLAAQQVGADRPRHRRGHDPRDAQEGPRECRQGERSECRVPARRA